MQAFKKVINPGLVKLSWSKVRAPAFIKIEWDGARLSLSGVIGPNKSGNCRGSCGQMQDSLSDIDAYADGWNAAKVRRLQDLWAAWHLNDMRAGCVHQRSPWQRFSCVLGHEWELSTLVEHEPPTSCPTCFTREIHQWPDSPAWDERRLDPEKPLGHGNMLTWIRADAHGGKGLLMKPCPVCGYQYGSKWLREDVPQGILQELRDLPSTTRQPAWV